MADGEITFQVNLDETKAKRELSKLQESIRKTTDELNAKKEQQSAIEAELKSASAEAKKTEAVIASLKKEILDYQEIQNKFGIKNPLGLSEAEAALKEQQAILNQQDSEVKRLYASYEKITDSILKSEGSLQGMQDKVSQIASELKRPTPFLNGMDKQFERAQKSATRFGRRITEIVKSALFFNLISSGLRRISEFIGRTLQTNAEYTAQLAKLRGALLTAFEPIYSYILPGLISILKIITSIVNAVANVISGLFGKTASQSAKNAKALNEQAAAIGGVGAAAEKAKKQLLEFDTLNILHGEESGAGGGGGGGSAVKVDFSEFDTDMPKSKVDELTAYLSGALLALGAILTFTGANIPLGLGLMALGAVGLASVAKENWGAMSSEVKAALVRVALILGTSMLALGAVLAFSGVHPAIGIALMALGAAGLISAAVINWHDVGDKTKAAARDIFIAISALSVVIGAVLVFSGANIGLGLGILAVSAASLAGAAALDWNYVSQNISSILISLFSLLAFTSLVVGAVLAFSGVHPVLGIALMALGAAGLATVVALNWSSIKESLTTAITDMYDWIAITSGALLAIGLVLAFTGVALPLGLALIAAGAAGLITVTALNWDTIKQKLSETWEKIKEWFALTVAPVFTIEYWQEKFQVIGDGIAAAIKEGLESAKRQIQAFFTGKPMPETGPDATPEEIARSIMTSISEQPYPVDDLAEIVAQKVVAGEWDKASAQAAIKMVKDSAKEGTKIDGMVAHVEEIVDANSGKIVSWITAEKAEVEGAVEDLVEDGIIAKAEETLEANDPKQIGEAVTDGVADGLSDFNAKVAPWQQSYSALIQNAVEDAQRGAIEIQTAFNGITMPPLYRYVSSPGYMPGTPFIPHTPRLANLPIPHLAKGTVIPPRAPFLAVLGDQSRGTNVETPVGVIEDAVAKVIAPREMLAEMKAQNATMKEQNALLRDVIYMLANIDDAKIGKMANRYNRGLDRAYGR